VPRERDVRGRDVRERALGVQLRGVRRAPERPKLHEDEGALGVHRSRHLRCEG
jgi:hypothetical protein